MFSSGVLKGRHLFFHVSSAYAADEIYAAAAAHGLKVLSLVRASEVWEIKTVAPRSLGTAK